jgi:hypothetical protein
MKKLLFQLDTDPIPSSFDGVVAYDSDIDHLMPFAGMNPDNVEGIVHGAIFTRGGKAKQYTAIFVGGSNLAQGEAVFDAVQGAFFSNFRVSIMLDSNGCNTTAAAAVAHITGAGSVAGKKAVVFAGTGPVGQRGAVLLAQEGADVILTSRKLDRAEAACQNMQERFGVSLVPRQVADAASTRAALEGAQVVLAAGAAGIELVPEELWKDNPGLEILVDINTVPPLGVGGLDMMDKGQERYGKRCFGGLGVGSLKMKVHRAAVAKLFEANNHVLDAREIYSLAKELVREAKG